VEKIQLKSSPFTVGANALIVAWGGPTAGSGIGAFMTGSFDNNFSDYQYGH